MKRNTITVAMLGIPDAQSRALIAATTVIQNRLPADLAWSTDTAEAGVVILNVDDAHDRELSSRLTADEATVIVPYSDHGHCPEHGIGRPLRMPSLQAALTRALQTVLERPPRSKPEIPQRRYRGQAVAEQSPAASADRETSRRRTHQRMYRGRSY